VYWLPLTLRSPSFTTWKLKLHATCTFVSEKRGVEIQWIICQKLQFSLCVIGGPIRVTPLEFQQELWRQKTRTPLLSNAILYAIIHLGILIEGRLVTGGQTNGQHSRVNRASIVCCVVKMKCACHFSVEKQLNFFHVFLRPCKLFQQKSKISYMYTVSHKKEPNYFCLWLREKSTDFNAVSTIRINDEWYIWRYELHPPHLINVATLPCESRNSKNVMLQWNITKENCIKRIVYASLKWTSRL